MVIISHICNHHFFNSTKKKTNIASLSCHLKKKTQVYDSLSLIFSLYPRFCSLAYPFWSRSSMTPPNWLPNSRPMCRSHQYNKDLGCGMTIEKCKWLHELRN